MQYFITQIFPFYLLKLLKYLYVHFKDNGCLIILTKKMFNYCNLLTHIFIDCILFKWKLYLFLDFLKYVCILLGIDGPNNKVIWKLSNYLRYFKKKIIFFKNFGGPGPPWSSSGSATGLTIHCYTPNIALFLIQYSLYLIFWLKSHMEMVKFTWVHLEASLTNKLGTVITNYYDK